MSDDTPDAPTTPDAPVESESIGGKTVQLDRHLLRALAHPMRNRMLGLLRMYGPQTATTLAGRLGVNTGATSYHLRQLADAGLVLEDDTRGNARDRWWKSAHQGTEFNTAEMLDQEPELAMGFLHGIGQTYAENMFGFIDSMETLPPEWRDASMLSDFIFHLRPEELATMLAEVMAVLEKYMAPDLTAPLPEGAEQVSVQIQAYPRETR
ncbi:MULTISPECIES: ArsR/SmtB family transcription factor [unclassified Kribbella]|uniref:ArsR/SmtB family transcription factor n=1 Tax=unclassified Kribbella TaxID=2644121 RepID=UPI003017509E